jgi:putative tryptophan/tyrosine transport system substrate-binding protein
MNFDFRFSIQKFGLNETMRKKIIIFFVAALILASVRLADAQQTQMYRVGVVHQGGLYYGVVDGLRDGLRELGFKERKDFVLEIRDAKGDLKSVEKAATDLEREKVNLIYAISSPVTLAVKRGTSHIPIVFCVGSDPVVLRLVESFANPGGRLTGVHFLAEDLTAKRLEVLKEMFPKLRGVVTFYDPNNRVAADEANVARDEAKRLKLYFAERPITSVEELRRGLQALKPGETEAFFYISDAMVNSQAQLIIETARIKRLPTMFQDGSLVAQGGLASYGVSFHEIGRLSATYVQRILGGTHPEDIPVENFYRVELVINLKTAQQLGFTIPQSVLYRADKVIK